MSAVDIKTLGIVAGGGELPYALRDRCKERGIKTHIVGLKNYVDDEALANIIVPIGSAGKIFKAFHAQGITDLVLIGKLGRPRIIDLKPDLKTLGFFARLGKKAFNGELGDDGLLKALRDELERDGFALHGVHRFLPELLAEEGVLTAAAPTDLQRADITLGIAESQKLGQADIGQSVIVHDGAIVGREDAIGTDALIRRADVGILVKTCKPQQDRDLDMPTIGPKTVQAAHENGLSGIAVQAGETLIADRGETIKLANDYGLFLIGVSL